MLEPIYLLSHKCRGRVSFRLQGLKPLNFRIFAAWLQAVPCPRPFIRRFLEAENQAEVRFALIGVACLHSLEAAVKAALLNILR